MRTIQYYSTRLTFKRNEIEPLDWNGIIIIDTPQGRFKMTKADFYEVFSNVVKTASYQILGSYNYETTPKKALRFLESR